VPYPRRSAPRHDQPSAAPETARTAARPGTVRAPATGSPAAILHLQRTVGNRATIARLGAARRIQRDRDRHSPTDAQAVQAKQDLKTSLGAADHKDVATVLAARFPKGPLFTPAEVTDIATIGLDLEGKAWLEQCGIGTQAAAMMYLHAANYRDWLQVSPGRRLLIATLAWTNGIGAGEPNPPPSFTLGRAMALRGGALGAAQNQVKGERDDAIRMAFVNTLMPVGGPDEVVARGEAGPEADEVIAKTSNAQAILKKILVILHAGLQVNDGTKHVPYRDGDVVRALAHGGRVNIRIPALQPGDDKNALIKWLGLIDPQGGKTEGVFSRGAMGTHRMDIGANTNGPGTGSFEEKGGTYQAVRNKKSGRGRARILGVNLAAGGLGKRDFNDEVILPNGGHGHLFIGFTKPTRKRDGALQVGIETTAPHAASPVGYKHTAASTEATANPESSFYGHKMDKVGRGKLKSNQRLVDLTQVPGGNWLAYLNQVGQDVDDAMTAAGNDARAQLEVLVGERLP
jgi:hypothetical protein